MSVNKEKNVRKPGVETPEFSARLLIEPFNPNVHDKAEIAATHLAIRQWQEKVGQNEFPSILESQVDLGAIDDYYVKPGGNFFVAKDSFRNKLIGFVGFRNDGNGRGVFKRLAVIPEYHRRGVATSLVTAAMDWARANGFSRIDLPTNKGENARPIYERFGFKVVGFDEENEDWLMALDLKGSKG